MAAPKTTRIYKGKNGYSSSYTKIKVNQGSKWVKESSTPRPKSKKK
jgi:hypothetical protein